MGGHNCGLFAVAIACSLANEVQPGSLQFDQPACNEKCPLPQSKEQNYDNFPSYKEKKPWNCMHRTKFNRHLLYM